MVGDAIPTGPKHTNNLDGETPESVLRRILTLDERVCNRIHTFTLGGDWRQPIRELLELREAAKDVTPQIIETIHQAHSSYEIEVGEYLERSAAEIILKWADSLIGLHEIQKKLKETLGWESDWHRERSEWWKLLGDERRWPDSKGFDKLRVRLEIEIQAVQGEVRIKSDAEPKAEPQVNPRAEQVAADAGGPISVRELAKKHNVDHERLRNRLATWRPDNDGGYIEVENRKPQEPKFLYRESEVMPVILRMKNG